MSEPLTPLQDIKNKISQMQSDLQQQLPGYEHLLRVIHTNLAQDDSTVHLLSEEEIGIIVAGLSKKKGVVLAEIETKTKKASLKGTTVDDL